ncbi:MAG: methylmalonyl Co-A mutase-associated GTPase MeaB [Mycobacteriales bacterium]
MLSIVEAAGPELPAVAALLAPHSTGARVIGLTGSPGVGKSTTTTALIAALRARGRRTAVLAIDPSSPFTGGALLGDRVRMQEHATDDGVYIRSMASRGHLGGLAAAAPQAVRAMAAAGYADVIVETVGAGQAEVDVARLADITVLLLAPGMGDGIQAVKAGIVEIADVLVVNKSDRDGAAETVRDLKSMLGLGGAHSAAGGWRPPIVSLVATRAEGIDDLLAALDKHAEWARRTGTGERRRQSRAAAEVEAIALGRLRQRLGVGSDRLSSVALDVAAGTMDAYAAADLLLED